MYTSTNCTEIGATSSTADVQKWYVAYTFPNAEKKVQNKLESIGIDAYLPLHQTIRSWSDRKKKLLVPLFPSYIFIRASPKRRTDTFTIKEILRYVAFEGRPAVISDITIQSLQNILSKKVEINIESFIRAGARVKITRGVFAGVEGSLIQRNGNTRLLVQIDALQQGITVNISIEDISPIDIQKFNIL